MTLVSPQLLNAYNMAPGTVPPVWDFGFVQIEMVGYQAQVMPAILAAFYFSLFRKILASHNTRLYFYDNCAFI